MINMFWIIRYLNYYFNPATANISEWFDGYVDRMDFESYLFNKFYREDIRETFQRLLATIQQKEWFDGDVASSRKQRREIYDAIDHCIRKKYIEMKDENFIRVTSDGRKFIKPTFFFNELLHEYGYLLPFIFGAGGATILFLLHRITNLLKDPIITILSKLIAYYC